MILIQYCNTTTVCTEFILINFLNVKYFQSISTEWIINTLSISKKKTMRFLRNKENSLKHKLSHFNCALAIMKLLSWMEKGIKPSYSGKEECNLPLVIITERKDVVTRIMWLQLLRTAIHQQGAFPHTWVSDGRTGKLPTYRLLQFPIYEANYITHHAMQWDD